ncbi:MAG: ABC transporter permease [Candidatus Competibacteraceae bacterium]|nr:ABC transporter permease [Candidatus Competibacteraceae bacterium]
MVILRLALGSLLNRRFTAGLTLGTIALSVCLLLAVERMRNDARESFASTLSGTDLIVGARSGEVQLLLYAVFRIGNATNNISWESYRDIAAHPRVAWTIPLSLGDSHRGFRVLGTSSDYFRHYRYGRDRALALAQGRAFEDVYEAVLGWEVARSLGYRPGQEIVIAHGAGAVSLVEHDDKPFTVVGILAPTATPVDHTVHISLEGMTAIHLDWRFGAPLPGMGVSAQRTREMDLTPRAITAFLVGLDSRIATFALQRMVNDYPEEPLLAVLPGVALNQLWSLVGVAEKALLLVSSLVVVTGLLGMLAVILSGLEERRREMAILRSLGARPWQVFALLLLEAGGLALAGAILGCGLLYGLLLLLGPWVEDQFGLFITIALPGGRELLILAMVVAAGLLMGLIPGYRAYRNSLADGLTVRI